MRARTLGVLISMVVVGLFSARNTFQHSVGSARSGVGVPGAPVSMVRLSIDRDPLKPCPSLLAVMRTITMVASILGKPFTDAFGGWGRRAAKLNAVEVSGANFGSATRKPRDEKYDVWVEGQSSYHTTDGLDGRRRARASVLYAGGDMVVAPGVIVGALYQRDWLSDTATTLGQNRDGAGGWSVLISVCA